MSAMSAISAMSTLSFITATSTTSTPPPALVSPTISLAVPPNSQQQHHNPELDQPLLRMAVIFARHKLNRLRYRLRHPRRTARLDVIRREFGEKAYGGEGYTRGRWKGHSPGGGA
ncbi:hypothetical protein EDC01DRAFT_626079 [Geopyxis carbonaria]|nr:hypothetical protein EDC01DRAFT_626079 [Geopyxis carbonaria]